MNGRDSLGGIKRNTTAAGITCPAASAILRQENCDNDITFNQRPTYTAANALPDTEYFDDILTYYHQ